MVEVCIGMYRRLSFKSLYPRSKPTNLQAHQDAVKYHALSPVDLEDCSSLLLPLSMICLASRASCVNCMFENEKKRRSSETRCQYWLPKKKLDGLGSALLDQEEEKTKTQSSYRIQWSESNGLRSKGNGPLRLVIGWKSTTILEGDDWCCLVMDHGQEKKEFGTFCSPQDGKSRDQ